MLAQYLLIAMLAWAPLEPARLGGEPPGHAQIRYSRIANDIAAVVEDPQEPPMRGGVWREALLLASLAFWESGYSEIVDEGRCAPHTCDNGFAWTLWQIHVGNGITLEGPVWVYARERSELWLSDHFDSVIRGPDMVQDRKLAVRVALHMLRRSGWVWTTFARARDHAAHWVYTHPLPAEAK